MWLYRAYSQFIVTHNMEHLSYRSFNMSTMDYVMINDKNIKYVNSLYYTTSCLGLTTNALALLLFLIKRKLLHGTMNILIFNQIVLDLFVSTCLLLTAIMHQPDDIENNKKNKITCILWYGMWFEWMFFLNSSYNVTAITFDRFIAICHPFRYRTRYVTSKLYIVLILLAVWISGPVFEGIFATVTTNIHKGHCKYYDINSDRSKMWLGIYLLIYTYIIPFTALVYWNLRMIWTLRKRTTLFDHEQAFDTYKNMLKTVLYLGITTLCCWTIERVYLLIYLFGDKMVSLHSWPYHICANITFLTVVLNPIIFVLRYEEFRLSAKEVLCCRSSGYTPL